MESSTNRYLFTPLRSHEARILLLSPGRDGSALFGSLQHISLSPNCYPPYEALSYEWGDPETTHAITLENNTITYITKSLHHALCDLRHEIGSSRAVWADGICINQCDVDERQRQVAMMGAIYRQSARVITYIGPETDGSRIAISFARYLIAYSGFLTRDNIPRPADAHELWLPPNDDPRWGALKALLIRGWVRREVPYSWLLSC